MTNTFEITSGKVIITDPCYDPDEDKIIPAKNGTWRYSVNMGDNNTSIAELIVLHENYYKVDTIEETLDFSCPVDSGQAGVFDADAYYKYQGGEYGDLDSFYGKCCNLTCDTYEQSGVIEMNGQTIGAVSSSNGDGDYEIAGFYHDDELYGIRIYFGGYCDVDDEEDEDWVDD